MSCSEKKTKHEQFSVAGNCDGPLEQSKIIMQAPVLVTVDDLKRELGPVFEILSGQELSTWLKCTGDDKPEI